MTDTGKAPEPPTDTPPATPPAGTPPAGYPFCRKQPCPWWFGYCRRDPACND
jgi:hypothetical protein